MIGKSNDHEASSILTETDLLVRTELANGEPQRLVMEGRHRHDLDLSLPLFGVEEVWQTVVEVMQSPIVHKILFEGKGLLKALISRGIKPCAYDDLTLASWVMGYGSPEEAVQAQGERQLLPYARRLLRDHPVQAAYQMEKGLTLVLIDMELKGIHYEPEDTVDRQLDQDLADLRARIVAMAGEPFDLESSRQVARILYERLRLPVPHVTSRGGLPSTDQAALYDLREQHPIVDQILDYRALQTLRSTFIEPLRRYRTSDQRIHSTFHQIGAYSGRLSSQSPNLQNIPAGAKDRLGIRKQFKAPPGRMLIVADYSQIELRLLAHFSQDEALCEAFQQGQDLHRMTAAYVTGKKPEEVTSEERSMAKAINFGLSYGMGPQGLKLTLHYNAGLDIGLRQAEQMMARFFSAYPKIRTYTDDLKRESRRVGYIRTLTGRYIRFEPTRGGYASDNALNCQLQGSAADLVKIAMVRLAGELVDLDAFIVLQVHDELVIEAPEDRAEAVRDVVKRAMEEAVPLRIPLKVSVSAALSWGEAKG